ncbi:hypothetical protein H8B15_04180 [Hymenobacter sp. BT507]|uniref:Uncharacterized protein n=1 Tax=Hymenobacter citatus TaxID=2763506 RepID=A0ABR7MGC3_9BACT|nr:hypothetical protein [Hymenobacter citatus]MBC6610106.1 hypothetical protein [Hymenobacter citatus]
MKKLLSPFSILGLLVVLGIGVYGYYSSTGIVLRNRYYSLPPEFRKLLKRFQRIRMGDESELLALPFIYKRQYPDQFNIALADKPLGLRKSQVLLRNPFAAAPYPLSFSVVYRGNLVTLFEPGTFACYRLPGLIRNRQLEKQLNTQNFEYHWLLNGQLVALSGSHYVTFSESGSWKPYAGPMPLNKQPKLFEDARYIVCMTCHGEWGGEVYFYDKEKHLYYIAEATCSNSIIKRDGKYFVVSSLAHMMGSAEVQQIDNPTEMTRWSGKIKPQDRDFEISYGAKLNHGKTVFDYREVLLLAGFNLNQEVVYLVNWNNIAFLATWQSGTFYVVDPLFFDDLYAHNPVTTAYGPDTVLVNLGLGSNEAERACLLFFDKKAIKINWSNESILKGYSVDLLPDSLNEGGAIQIVDSVEVKEIK